MESVFKEEKTILPSVCDKSARLKMSGFVDMCMDAAMVHAEELGVGITEFRPKNRFWIVTKTKIRFLRPVCMAEKTVISTWPTKPGSHRCERHYELRKGDEVLAVGKNEWLVIDTVDKTLKPTSEIYPKELEISDKKGLEEPFARLRTFEGEQIGTYRVRSVDIDYGEHMNNVAYIRAIEGLFESDELKKADFDTLDIQYKKSCYEGDLLIFTAKKEEDGLHICGALEDSTVIVNALLSRENV